MTSCFNTRRTVPLHFSESSLLGSIEAPRRKLDKSLFSGAAQLQPGLGGSGEAFQPRASRASLIAPWSTQVTRSRASPPAALQGLTPSYGRFCLFPNPPWSLGGVTGLSSGKREKGPGLQGAFSSVSQRGIKLFNLDLTQLFGESADLSCSRWLKRN